MAYVPIPKDLANVKTKVAFNLTKRQLICFGMGALVGVPVFFFIDGFGNTNLAVLLMIFTMFPFFMFAMYEKHNQSCEVLLKQYLNVRFFTPKQRIYQTRNFYEVVERQQILDREVANIVKKANTDKRRQKANRSGNCKSKKQD